MHQCWCFCLYQVQLLLSQALVLVELWHLQNDSSNISLLYFIWQFNNHSEYPFHIYANINKYILIYQVLKSIFLVTNIFFLLNQHLIHLFVINPYSVILHWALMPISPLSPSNWPWMKSVHWCLCNLFVLFQYLLF